MADAQSPVERFRSDAGRERFFAAYDELLGSWTVPYESVFVGTSFGETHVVVSGPLDGEPLVMVPGGQGTAGMWGPVMTPLAARRRVYCLDLIDQVGRSRPERVLTNGADCSAWVGQTLDGLGLTEVDLAGNSLGSFIAANVALRLPERIRNLVLTAPAATVAPISPGYLLQAMLAMLLPFERSKLRFYLRTSAGNADPTSPLFRLLVTAMVAGRNVSKLLPREFTDEELASLAMPVLAVFGGQDPVNRGGSLTAARRAEQMVPNLRYEILKGAGHLWSNEQFEQCAELVDDFLP